VSFRFDLYAERPGWAHRVDPRVKLLFVLTGTVTMILFSNVFFMLAALGVVHWLLVSASVPRARLVWVWKAMLPVNVLIPLLWMVFYPEGDALLEWWIVRVTPLALARGVGVAARLDTIAFICFSWLFTTDQASIVRSLVKLGMPFEWGLVLAISLRYIPTFYGLYAVVAEAQQARALDLTQGNFFRKLRSYLPILVAMVINALRTADKLARALESRALGVEEVQRTYLHDIRFTHRDYVLSGVLLLILCGGIVLRVMGVFVHPFYLVS
jgi:energy-coupling factor transport system permease protein